MLESVRRASFRSFVVAATLVAGGVVTAATPAAAAACSDIDVVVARGTFEPGTLGAIVGDPVYSAVKRKLAGKSTAAYAVDYPASLDLTSATQGNIDLVDHVTRQASSCPSQRFVLVGYSQGANVVSNSIGVSSAGAVVGAPIASTIPSSLASRVAAVVVFGPPIGALGKHITGTYQSRTKEYCAFGDPVCNAIGLDPLAHLSYGGKADDAAAFVAGKV
jgi:cutinase